MTVEHEGVHIVLRADEPPALPLDSVASLSAVLVDHPTVVVGTVVDDEIDALITALESVHQELLNSGTSLLHLVMAYGAQDTEAGSSAARRLCEQWGVDVVASTGAAFLVPGGTLFSPDGPSGQGGWWLFSPGHVPKRLGARYPTPLWERAVERLRETVAGHVVQQVPAGLLLHTSQAPAEDVNALRFAVPVAPFGPAVLIGVSGSPRVSPEAVASVLAALPGPVRRTATLLPGDGTDVLATGQDVADTLGIGVRVGTGLPVLLEEGPTPSERTGTVLVDGDGTPSWQPFVEVVTCLPAEDGITPPPRPEVWRAPVPGLREAADPGVVLLDDSWQVVLTRAGMRVERRGARTSFVEERPVDPQVMAVELGAELDPSAWPVLERLFAHLPPDMREHVMIQVHGEHGAEDLKALRRMAIRHELALAPQGWRSIPEVTGAVLLPPVAGTATRPWSVPGPASAALSVPTPPTPSTAPSSPAGGGPSSPPASLLEEASVPPAHSSALPAHDGPEPQPEPDHHPDTGPELNPALAPELEPEPEPDPPTVQELTPPPVTGASLSPGVPPRLPTISSGPPAADSHHAPPSPAAAGDSPAASRRTDAEAETEPEAIATAGEFRVPIPGTPSSREIVQRPLDILRPSSPAEHARLRTYLGRDWDRHVAAVGRALTHFPGLRSVSADSEITADLAAVHAYLHADALGQGADAVRAALRSGDPDLLAYLACLTSGLRRLPSYRGAALRVTDVFDEVVRDLLPGEEVVEAVPVGAVPLGKGYSALPRDHYLIWSATGRRTDVLMDSEDSHRQADVLFSPGTRFRVLRAAGPRAGATVVLLRELPLAAPVAVPGVLDDTDRQIADRLADLADRPPPGGGLT
ncbi:hypothetical protein ACKI1Q_36040 [Streptomyces galilaeus]|uniref:hypothetical protein n=1 Tax=Streptomyces galilaeus TaxID=33899 RepID=UPI0038F6D6A1